MKLLDDWWFPDNEAHLPAWMANPKVRMHLNGRPAYQGKKQLAALGLCKQRRTAIDVGAHIGLWSYNLGHWFDNVAAFEPVAEHRACFMKNVPLENVLLLPVALGEKACSVSIHTAPTSSGDSWVDGVGSIEMVRLDEKLVELPDLDFIKLDCEGYELFALRGGEELIKRTRPVICVEQKPGKASKFGLRDTEAVDYLRGLGAELRLEISGDYIMSW